MIRATFDDMSKRMSTKAPIWFDTSVHNSLATWLAFYLEMALYVHYQAYVRGLFRGADGELHSELFIRRDNQYLNLKNELSDFWESLPQGKDRDQFQRFI